MARVAGSGSGSPWSDDSAPLWVWDDRGQMFLRHYGRMGSELATSRGFNAFCTHGHRARTVLSNLGFRPSAIKSGSTESSASTVSAVNLMTWSFQRLDVLRLARFTAPRNSSVSSPWPLGSLPHVWSVAIISVPVSTATICA